MVWVWRHSVASCVDVGCPGVTPYSHMVTAQFFLHHFSNSTSKHHIFLIWTECKINGHQHSRIWLWDWPNNVQSLCTLFSKRSAHENNPIFLRSLGWRTWPLVILLFLLDGLESKSQKTPCQNLITTKTMKTIWQTWHDPGSGSVTLGHLENWTKSMCTSFGEERTLDLNRQYWWYNIMWSTEPTWRANFYHCHC